MLVEFSQIKNILYLGQPSEHGLRLLDEHTTMSKIIAFSKSDNLVKRLSDCRKGDERAMRWIFEEYGPKMLGVCRRYLHRNDLAEEALSSGFARVFDYLHTLREDLRFEGWMKSIMVRECIDTIRREKKYWQVDDPDSYVNLSTHEVVDSGVHAEDLLNLIDTLPAGYRMVFNLFAIEGYSHREIAEMLGISENTSKTQYKKSREAIQARMDIQKKTKNYSYGSL